MAPSTTRSWPLMKLDSSLARNTAAWAMSPGLPEDIAHAAVFVAGEEHRGMGDVFGQTRARYGLRGLVDLAHHVGRLLRRLDRKSERLAEDTGRDRAR